MAVRKLFYLLSLFLVFVIPTIVEGYFIFDRIDKLNLALFIGGILVIGSVWDVLATRHGKNDPVWLWQFNEKDILGVKFFDLPIEEYLFYVVSSVYVIFTWESFRFVSETGNPAMYAVLPFVAMWSLFFIGLPYVIKFRNKDKL